MNDFTIIFSTLTSLVAAIPVVTQGVKKLIDVELPSWVNQVLSWTIGIVLCFAGWLLNLGFLVDTTWWQTLIIGIGVSLAANGVFDIELVKNFLNCIFGKIEKK